MSGTGDDDSTRLDSTRRWCSTHLPTQTNYSGHTSMCTCVYMCVHACVCVFAIQHTPRPEQNQTKQNETTNTTLHHNTPHYTTLHHTTLHCTASLNTKRQRQQYLHVYRVLPSVSTTPYRRQMHVDHTKTQNKNKTKMRNQRARFTASSTKTSP